MPAYTSSFELANRFNTFFKEKISKIRKSFPAPTTRSNNSNYSGELLTVLRPATEEEIRKIVSKFSIKCSPEDPVPAKLLANCIDFFVPIWLDLVNLSLEQGSFECLKSAVVLPLLKGLDTIMNTEIFKNYRPVSNLQFLGKIIERVVDIRLDEHMEKNNLHSNKQYGYKAYHSTEMLLTKVANDLLIACDDKIATLMMLLDLSAAFDTVDQEMLLKILSDEFGIRGVALEWFRSFLIGRTQRVMIDDEFSNAETLDFGVAQGSVLGPKLFNIYIQSFIPTMQAIGVEIEGYADDHQLRKRFNLVFQFQVLTTGISNIFSVAETWMFEFFLMINCTKTQIMIVAPEALKKLIIINGVFVGDTCIRFVEEAKNLGICIDSTLTFDVQVNKVAKGCHATLRQLARIKKFLTKQDLQTLVSALVLSKIDCCNSLYYKLKSCSIKKLQSIQNSAARIVMKTNRFDRVHSADLLMKLHWLKIEDRIVYKLLVLVYKCIEKKAPNDLSALIVLSDRSRHKKLVERCYKSSYGERAFSVCGPKLWNSLPHDLRAINSIEKFKEKLKTYLFKKSYNC